MQLFDIMLEFPNMSPKACYEFQVTVPTKRACEPGTGLSTLVFMFGCSRSAKHTIVAYYCTVQVGISHEGKLNDKAKRAERE